VWCYTFDTRGRRKGYMSADTSATYGYNDDDRLISFAKDAGRDGTIDVSASYVGGTIDVKSDERLVIVRPR
jgi:hypothetical protein